MDKGYGSCYKMNITTDCWYWAGSHAKSGYGTLWDGEKNKRAHRVVYEALVGEIPQDLELDHLCKNKLCVNPEHLEAVTHAENMNRVDYSAIKRQVKTHCPKGHLLDRIRTHYGKTHKECGTCKKELNRIRSIKRSEERVKLRLEKGLPMHQNSLLIKGTEAQIR